MILVTGATGILGRMIVLELLKSGQQVRAAKRKFSDLAEVQDSFKFYTENYKELFQKIVWVDLDFQDIDSLSNALSGIDQVYHCAGKVSFHPDDRQEIYQLNIEGTKNLLYACQSAKVKKFCFISSVAVLDGVDENGLLTENSEFNSKIPHSAYAKSKHFSEMEVWRSSAEGLQTVILNPGVIIGSGNWQGSSGQIFKTFETQKWATSGYTSYVDVRDVANIAVMLMDSNSAGQRFIVVSETVKTSVVADLIRKQLQLSASKIIPNNVLKLGRVLNILLGWLISPLRLLTKTNIEAVTGHQKISNQKVKDLLQYQFIPVKESLSFHLQNYRASKKSATKI